MIIMATHMLMRMTSPPWISLKRVNIIIINEIHIKMQRKLLFCSESGAPNEDIVQNHKNIALLNVIYYLNDR